MVYLSLPSTLTTISERGFYNCSNFIGPLIIPDSVITIGKNAFHYCTSLTSLTLGNNVKTIDYHAFALQSDKADDIYFPLFLLIQ